MSSSKKPSIILLPPAVPGSLGDEAQVVVVVEAMRAKGYNVDIFSYKKDYKWGLGNKVSKMVEVEPHFKKDFITPKESLSKLFSKYKRFYMLGADIMDGYYSVPWSLRKINMLKTAKEAGLKTVLLGSSFNHSPNPKIIKSLSELPKTVRLCARDPVSYKRCKKFLPKNNFDLVADVAFQLKPKFIEIESHVKKEKQKGRHVIGININWLIASNIGISFDKLASIYAEFMNKLCKKGFSFVLLPHDFRKTKKSISDVEFTDIVLSKLDDETRQYCFRPKLPYSAAQIKYIVKRLDFVVSGRMHLAIACLGQGVPVACIVYQGKFEGLFGFFGLKKLLMDPKSLLKNDSLLKQFEKLFPKRKTIKKKILTNLPKVMKYSRKNFI
ncbi:MAG: polysaccharide pyruvyl transferase family protein [Candidatus Woesearchaeota archaeon]|jgi:polysaccharide pyruvyl transferase WcaK-like protein|nr:polysaccharide pyruvyl transferase family protein [Candidatus Woesearchaeota archaeon]MDP7610584.1 polysaccharide pyruvyl transferase family protein [Candidatus Woesearchaeota archaeon]